MSARNLGDECLTCEHRFENGLFDCIDYNCEVPFIALKGVEAYRKEKETDDGTNNSK